MKIVYDDGELIIVLSRGETEKGFVFADDDEVNQIYDGIEAYRENVRDPLTKNDTSNLKIEFEIDEKTIVNTA